MKRRDLTAREPRRDRLIRERVHDPYMTRLKLSEPTVCRQCGAVYRSGRWRWGPAPEDANADLCQACRRINDKFPAGELTLGGRFAREHRSEILRLARNEEKLEKGAHPLHRIMDIRKGPDAIVITCTDIHLPRRIGDALHRAYEGTLDYRYEKETYFIRVKWRRDG